MKEWFRDIKGFEGLYTISHSGTVLNKKGQVKKSKVEGSSTIVYLYKEGKKYSKVVNTLVYDTFKIKRTCKRCPSCNTFLKNTEFRERTNGNLYSWCKNCMEECLKANSKVNKTRILNSRLLNTYGITLEDYNKMSELQDHKCKLCDKHKDDNKHKKLYVDHCHSTGRVRGLLCCDCNIGLGMFKDNTKVLINAVKYLY